MGVVQDKGGGRGGAGMLVDTVEPTNQLALSLRMPWAHCMWPMSTHNAAHRVGARVLSIGQGVC